MLMVFINEANETSSGRFHISDILQAVEQEYEAFYSTISDTDLMFVMAYIQDKRDQLLDKCELEDLLCDELLSKKDELSVYRSGFIYYKRKCYQIEKATYSGRVVSTVLIRRISETSLRGRLRNLYFEPKVTD